MGLERIQWKGVPDSEVVVNGSAMFDAPNNLVSPPIPSGQDMIVVDESGFDCCVGNRAKKVRREAKKIREMRTRPQPKPTQHSAPAGNKLIFCSLNDITGG